MSGGECGDINKHIGKHRVCLLNMYVSFLVLSFSFLFFCGGCLCCNGAPLGSFWASLMGPLH